MDTDAFLKGLDQAFGSRQHEKISEYLEMHLAKAEKEQNIPARITVLNEMTGYYRSVSKYKEAIVAGERAADLMRGLGDTCSPAFGTVLLNLATAYNAAGNSLTALKLYEQVLVIYQKHLPTNHMSFTALYNNMGSLYLEMREDSKALQVLQKALPILGEHKTVYGETATIYTNLAQALFRLHKQAEALQVLNMAMRIFEGNPVRRDPHYAAALAASGQMYYAMQEYALAVQAYEAALHYTKACYGENKDFATICDNCALALDALGDKGKSATYREQGKMVRSNLTGTKHQSSTALEQTLSFQYNNTPPQSPISAVALPSSKNDDFVGAMLHEVDKLLWQSYKNEHKTETGQAIVTPSTEKSLPSGDSPRAVAINMHMQAHTKGLELARAYYEAHGKEMIAKLFPKYSERIATGLVGEGSECFGFDDAISADHDFGPAFCMWLTREDYKAIGQSLQTAYEKLPQTFRGLPVCKENKLSSGRVGVQCIDSFYQSRIGKPDAQLELMDWLHISESRLAVAANGEVFHDPLGQFSRIRQQLLNYYPEDVRIKKIAARAFLMGQSGQYNYGRSMSRGEHMAAMLALQEFIKQTCHMVFLLNKKYPPFYKWLHHGMKKLPVLQEVAVLLEQLASNALQPQHWQEGNAWTLAHSINKADPNVRIIEQVCNLVRQQLYHNGLSGLQDDFLSSHVEAITKNITDSGIRALPLLEG